GYELMVIGKLQDVLLAAASRATHAQHGAARHETRQFCDDNQSKFQTQAGFVDKQLVGESKGLHFQAVNTTITLVDPDVAFIGRGETETWSEVPLGVLLLDCKVVAAEASVLFV